jgi:hypothetical protein
LITIEKWQPIVFHPSAFENMDNQKACWQLHSRENRELKVCNQQRTWIHKSHKKWTYWFEDHHTLQKLNFDARKLLSMNLPHPSNL